MKIVHFCLSCFYVDGYGYQENRLPAQHVKDGHEVTIVASTESFDEERRPCYLQPGDYMGTDGARVIRLPYRQGLPTPLARKVRAYPRVRQLLNELQPDVILFHGMCAWELLTVASYVREHPEVTLYVDCHEDFNNSARGWLSRHLLHGAFYRPILRSALDVVKEVLCITVESIQFAEQFYGVPSRQIALFPLAGHIHDDADYESRRLRLRQAHGVAPDDVVIVQSGKITANKLLPDALRAFVATPSPRLRFWIVGQIVDGADECQALIAADSRIRFLGWKSPEELEDVLCAADVFLQPAGQTATTQMSMCCRCAVLVSDVPSHQALFVNNGFLINERTTLAACLQAIAQQPQAIAEMKQRSLAFAREHLDYTQLARRIAAPGTI
ncbi:MAG: glycosyltransferase family 4 protein [Roseateles sp.]